MLRKPIRRYGRTVVVTEAQLAFDNILGQTDEDTKASPFCSSDSSHTSGHNCSISMDCCSLKPVTTQTRHVKANQKHKNLKKVKDTCNKKDNNESQASGSDNKSSNLLFLEESNSFVLSTPVKKKRQLKVPAEKYQQPRTSSKLNTNKENNENIPSTKIAGERCYSLQENVPDFDDIAKDDLIICSTPGELNKHLSGRLTRNTSIFSQNSPNVSIIIGTSNQNLQPVGSSPSCQNCANVTFRRCKRDPKAKDPKAKKKLKSSKNKHSPDSGNLSDDNAAFELCDPNSSELSMNISADDDTSLLDDMENVTSSFHMMRLRSFNIAKRLASSPQSSLYSDESLQDSEADTSASQLTSSPILFEEDGHVVYDQHSSSMPLIAEEDSCYSDSEDDEHPAYAAEQDLAINVIATDEQGMRSQSFSMTDDTTVEDLANTMSFSEKLSNSSLCPHVSVTARERVLSLCCQTQPISFSESIPTGMLSNCVKIGEGVYGEVFRSLSQGQAVALKIIPIEGDQEVNDCPQKRFDEILPEIVIAKELSDLIYSDNNQASSFCQVKRVSCVKGVLPRKLLDQWDIYAKENASENDRPDMFSCDQLFIVFEFVDGGCPVENYKFLNQLEAFSVLRQVIFALAVAESELEFEHRDLHIGNVLVRPCPQATMSFKLEGKKFMFPTEGVKATIIDFTISRLKKDGCAVFFDISTDDGLFDGQGDFQFDVYRDMRIENGNDWQKYCPHSNVLWVNYLLKKFVQDIKYKDKGRNYRDIQRHMRSMLDKVLGYPSCLSMSQDSSLCLPHCSVG